MLNEKPLISFILLAYNQEKYIEEAIEAAFKQTYSPLEIILSDDCSTDNTYNLIENMVQNYRGLHTIILNRNKENLGICGHVNFVLEMTSGKLIVMAAGDDISDVDRVTKIHEVWQTSDDKTRAVFSNAEKIDAIGTHLGPIFPSKPLFSQTITDFKQGIECWALGASLAIDKNLYKKYGEIDSKNMQEDGCLAFRALLEGNILYIDQLLVKYRHHDKNVSQTTNPARRLVMQKNEYFLKTGWLREAQRFCSDDLELILLLKRLRKMAFMRKAIWNIPFVGYIYNFLKIEIKAYIAVIQCIIQKVLLWVNTQRE